MDVVNKLRCETSDLHERLEETVLLRSLMSPKLSPERYIELLIWLYRHWVVLERLEQEIRPSNIDSVLIPPQRADSALLDAMELNKQTPGVETKAIRLPSIPHGVSLNRGGWLGLVYVMRGSEMGGQVIRRHLRTHGECRFLADYASFFVTPDTDCSWPRLLGKLDEEALATESPFACVQSAVGVFQWLIRGSDRDG